MVEQEWRKLKKRLDSLEGQLAASQERERRLQAENRYYRAIFDHAIDGVIIVDPEEGRPVEFNDQACRQLGYTREEFARLEIRQVEALESPEMIRKHMEEVARRGHDVFETVHRTKSGELRNVLVHAQVIDVGDREVYQCICRDITERKRMEQDLRESEEKFRQAFNSSPDAVSINRLKDGLYVDINEGFTNNTGYGREEVIGKTSVELNIWNDPAERQELVRGLRENGYYENLEAEFRIKDGSVIKALMSARVISLNGEPHIISITRDITERKRHEEEQLKIEKLESLGVLAGGIAHDFNNILTGVLGNISFAKALVSGSEQVAAVLATAEKAAVRASGLAHQLLTFSKGGEPVKKPVSLNALVGESFSLALHGSNVKGENTLGQRPLTVEADEGQLSQVFHNIILNGAQAMPGGGTIRARAEEVTLERGNRMALPLGKYIKLEFRDHGCGIGEEDRKRIFDPYFTTKSKGSGLGLTSAYSIVKRHHGHLDVDSEIGHGTTVTIYLPSTEAVHAEDRGGREAIASKGGGGRVLVMDDEQTVLDVAAGMLEYLEFDVTLCTDGREAVELYRQAEEAGRPFRAVIMDLTIPGGKGGREAAGEILQRYPEAYLIVSSGYSNDPVMAEYRRYGFGNAVAKPFNLADLERAMSLLPQKEDLP